MVEYLLRKNQNGEELWMSKNTFIIDETLDIKCITIDNDTFIFNNNKLQRATIKNIEYNFTYNDKDELYSYTATQTIEGYYLMMNPLRKLHLNDIEYYIIIGTYLNHSIFLLDKYGMFVDNKAIDHTYSSLEFLYNKDLILIKSEPPTYRVLNKLLYKKEIIDGGYRETYSPEHYTYYINFIFDFDHTGKLLKFNYYDNRRHTPEIYKIPLICDVTYDEHGNISIPNYNRLLMKIKQLKNGNITIYLGNQKYLTFNKLGYIISKPYQDIEYKEI